MLTVYVTDDIDLMAERSTDQTCSITGSLMSGSGGNCVGNGGSSKGGASGKAGCTISLSVDVPCIARQEMDVPHVQRLNECA